MASDIDFITSYFTEEKISASIMIILGSIYVLSGLFFLFIIKYSFFKGMGIPLLLIGGIQCIMGSTLIIQTSAQISRIEYQLKQDHEKIKSEELPRMKAVQGHFTFYRWLEIIALLIGLFLYIRFFNSTLPFWKGLGLGLLLPAAFLFTLDFMAEKRASSYVDFLSGVF